MFFLLRIAFWLGLVCVLLPTGGSASKQSPVDAAEAVSAATAAVSDMTGFCERQPDACVVGGKVAVALGQKAEAGARSLYEIISAKIAEKSHEAQTENAGLKKPAPSAARGTLTANDLTPVWHAPVPLPPRRADRTAKPAA
ncbi:MAG: DUF5330 domain-containing protein [Pseudolabrys sp.]|nr:DUF5330 domain-containing protein [Pseudolabrys sp.]MBV9260277.1 DUF5330 domain-containing protein [Pseudolabrys sp.]